MKRLLFLQFLARPVGVCSLALLALPLVSSAQIIDPIYGAIPEIRITAPQNHATFYSPVDIPIFAYVTGTVYQSTNVHIFAGTNDLGQAFDLGLAARPPGVYLPLAITATPFLYGGSVYCLVWTNPAPGAYTLKAVAKSRLAQFQPPELAQSRTSAPVNITVLPGATTATNKTDIVTILATDPVAIAGTNSWFWPGITNTTPAWSNWPPPFWQYTTNWGPKSAAFTVRRYGDATSALTVDYTIGGSASNGVDYAELPGTITIPAGGAYAVIPIVPVFHTATTPPKTVVLTVTSNAADYVVGLQKTAAAIILGDIWVRPLPLLTPERGFHLNASGPDGAWFIVEYTTDMKTWTPVVTNQVFQGSIDYLDPDTTSSVSKFYRTVPLAGPPTE